MRLCAHCQISVLSYGNPVSFVAYVDNISELASSPYRNLLEAVTSQQPAPTVIVIMGAYVSQCVLHTALAAQQLGYCIIIVEDACVAYPTLNNVAPDKLEQVVEGHWDLLTRCAVVLNVEDFISGIQ